VGSPLVAEVGGAIVEELLEGEAVEVVAAEGVHVLVVLLHALDVRGDGFGKVVELAEVAGHGDFGAFHAVVEARVRAAGEVGQEVLKVAKVKVVKEKAVKEPKEKVPKLAALHPSYLVMIVEAIGAFKRAAGSKLYVGNLPWSVDSSQLAEICQDFGTVEVVEVIYDQEPGRSLRVNYP
jgi:hypothetical protein